MVACRISPTPQMITVLVISTRARDVAPIFLVTVTARETEMAMEKI